MKSMIDILKCVCVILGFIFVLCCLDSLGIYTIFLCPQEKKLSHVIFVAYLLKHVAKEMGAKCASAEENVGVGRFFHVFIHTFVRSFIQSRMNGIRVCEHGTLK